MSDEYLVTVERDGDFVLVEVKEAGQRVAYYTIEEQYAPGIVEALRRLVASPDRPRFHPLPDCLWPEHCIGRGRCALDCRGE